MGNGAKAESSAGKEPADNTEELLNARSKQAYKLLDYFAAERTIHRRVALVAAVSAIVCALFATGQTLTSGEKLTDQTAALAGLWGASGAVTLSIGRILWMFKTALKAIITGRV